MGIKIPTRPVTRDPNGERTPSPSRYQTFSIGQETNSPCVIHDLLVWNASRLSSDLSKPLEPFGDSSKSFPHPPTTNPFLFRITCIRLVRELTNTLRNCRNRRARDGAKRWGRDPAVTACGWRTHHGLITISCEPRGLEWSEKAYCTTLDDV